MAKSSEADAPSEATLIRAYGEYWSRTAVDWKSKELSGQRRHYRKTSKSLESREKRCNAWEQRGIYALYSDFKLIYVGMASSSDGIGSRLYAHHEKPRLTRRWDSFSWFGIDGFDHEGKRTSYAPIEVNPNLLVRSLELAAILIADPPLNRSQGRFKGAEQLDQVVPEDWSSTELELLREILVQIKRK
jgi:hypothetical protein